MKITVAGGGELTEEQARTWARLQESAPGLASPYLRPEFTAAVAAVRDDVRVGLLWEGERLAGFFPFQLAAGGAGVPVAAGLNDVQGVVAEPGLRWSAEELIRGCGLRSWNFNHLLADQEPFRPYYETELDACHIDLSRGYEAWARERRGAGSALTVDVARKRRKLEREAGPLDFRFHVEDEGVLRRLMEWKSQQYLRTGFEDRFAEPWIVALLTRLHRLASPGLAGVLSALWAGGELVAAQFGMRSGACFHWWFPSYDRRLARYSPGLLLHLLSIEAAAALGIRRFDLGSRCPQKERLMSGTVRIARGLVEV